MKTSLRIASLVLAIFLFIGTFTPGVRAAQVQQKLGVAFVTASSLRLRSQPNTTSKTLDYAPKNDVVVLLEKVGQWYKVRYNLQTGYMSGNYLNAAIRENAELGYGRVTGNKVHVRSGPGTGYAAVATVHIGDRPYIIGINNGWFKVIIGDHIGYIRSDYVELTEIPYENQDSPHTPLFFRGGKSTGVTPSPGALKGGPVDNMADKIIATAKQYLGVPYLWGGTTPNGFDCSGYTQYVFRAHGITLPRSSSQQYTVGTYVSKGNLKPGDLVFFDVEGNGISHVGIYVGNNQFIHCSTSKGVVITSLSSTYWAPRYYGARRVL